MSLDEVAIRVNNVISDNFGDKKQLDLAEKISLCSLLEDEFDINIDCFFPETATLDDIYESVRKILREKQRFE